MKKLWEKLKGLSKISKTMRDRRYSKCSRCANSSIKDSELQCRYGNYVEEIDSCSEFKSISTIDNCKMPIETAYRYLMAGKAEFIFVDITNNKRYDMEFVKVEGKGSVYIRYNNLENYEEYSAKSWAYERWIDDMNDSFRGFRYNLYLKIENSKKLVMTIVYKFDTKIFQIERVDTEDSLTVSLANKFYDFLYYLIDKSKWVENPKYAIYINCKCSRCGERLNTIYSMYNGIHTNCLEYLSIPIIPKV